MNPYEANLRNISSRIAAWIRGFLRAYRRPVIVIIAAGATMAVGVNAARAPEAALSAPVFIAQR